MGWRSEATKSSGDWNRSAQPLAELTPAAHLRGSLPRPLPRGNPRVGRLILGPASRLDAFSGYRLGTWLPGFCRWRDSRYTRGAPNPGPLVLWAGPLKRPPPTADRDRPVLRRSEPSSRSPLMGEQTNPWELVHPQDGLSRHRGAEPGRRSGLSGPTSLLSPGYPLSAERWPFHTGPPDH